MYKQTGTQDVAKLLRSIGASGRLVGFNYIVFIVNKILQSPGEHYWLTKCAYPDAAKHFGVKPASVEHAIRTVIASCWDRHDHSDINRVAGIQLEKIPTNSEFIDILVAYLRYGAYERS
ncbi:MAG: sporulation initiation factor Spo0A C-terminal domain-containing protein [Oscillospiraceae bacterium]|nr:sporulation initiation factor Spo0A C-terminal domain-containing protein [Oscillospiraceae bacterium]